MKRIALISTFVVVGAMYILGVGVALADGVKGVAVKPLSPKAGEVITVKGELLGPESTVEVRVIGNGVDIDLGEVKADDEGDFAADFTLPADLKAGTYELKATGAESASTQIRVAAGAGGAGSTIPAGAMAPSASMAQQEEAPLRERPLGETVALVALFGVLAGVGLFLARTAERSHATA